MRRFECSDEKSLKFWEIEVAGVSVTTRWGRIGTNGRTKTKELATEAKAEAELRKLIGQKTKKGYAEVGGGSSSTPAAPSAPPKNSPENRRTRAKSAAVWAFREGHSPAGGRLTVELGRAPERARGGAATRASARDDEPLDLRAQELARSVLLDGVERSVPHWDARAAPARAGLRKVGRVWLELALDELSELVHVRAVRVASVGETVYRPETQVLHAFVLDATGAALHVVREHRAVAPNAVDAIGAALTGRFGEVRWISGEVGFSSSGVLQLAPFLIVTDERVIVPDLEPGVDRVELPSLAPAGGGDWALGVDNAIEAAVRALDDLAHQGLRHTSPALLGELQRRAGVLKAEGRSRTAGVLSRVRRDVAALGGVTSPQAEARATAAWAAAAIRVRVALEVEHEAIAR